MSAIQHSTTGGKWGQSSCWFFCDSPERFWSVLIQTSNVAIDFNKCLDWKPNESWQRCGTRLADNIRFSFSQFSVGLQRKKKSLYGTVTLPTVDSQTQCESIIQPLPDLSGPFKTKQWSAVIVPSAQHHPAAVYTSASLQPLWRLLLKSSWICDLVQRNSSDYYYFAPTPFPLWEDWIICEWKWFGGTEDVCEAAAAVHVVVLCLLRGLTLLPPPQPQQLCHWRSSVSQRDISKFCIAPIPIQGQYRRNQNDASYF